MDINTPVDELVELWTRNSVRIIQDLPDKDKALSEMREIKLILIKKGIQNISIQLIDDDICTCKYNYRGNIVIAKVSIKDL